MKYLDESQRKKLSQRVDYHLLELGFAQTLDHAKALVMAGQVIANNQRIDKPAEYLKPGSKIRIKGLRPYCSRGGEKLLGAMKAFRLINAFSGKRVLDIGSSSGGFSDCALKHGAKEVIALDVGTNQLNWKLRQDPRIVSLEQTDIREFKRSSFGPIDWILVDISFNRLACLASAISNAAPGKVSALLLVKPQFELDSSNVGPNGIVNSKTLRSQACQTVQRAFIEEGFSKAGETNSILKGRTGNQETFLYLTRP